MVTKSMCSEYFNAFGTINSVLLRASCLLMQFNTVQCTRCMVCKISQTAQIRPARPASSVDSCWL
jgi:hypothetical protein